MMTVGSTSTMPVRFKSSLLLRAFINTVVGRGRHGVGAGPGTVGPSTG